MQHDANLIGRKIARLRYQKGWTQDTLVARLQIQQCNITRDILASIEVRRSVVTDKHCCFIAKALGVTIHELFQP
jgi:transcriptional regulator with XRE-family HTH domain